MEYTGILDIIRIINSYLTNYVIVFLLLSVGIYFTIKTRFVQVRCFGEGWRKTFGSFSFHGKKASGGITSYQAFATCIAAQVGTGNVVGACSAILIGGPGAVFWLWVAAFFGMATMYAEAVLAQDTKQTLPDGSVTGGPVYYIQKAFAGKWGRVLSVLFAIAFTFAIGFAGMMVQSNSIAETSNLAFHIPTWIVGLVVVVVAGVIFFGGMHRVVSVSEKIMPVMAGGYIIGCVVVLCARIAYLPDTIWMILKYAFVPNAILGGGIGAALKIAISQGVKRGLFSNEAGMGSTPHAHALAKGVTPHEQGMVAMIAVFVDTFIILSLTALVVISTLYTQDGILAHGAVQGVEPTNMAQMAFATVFGAQFSSVFIAVCILFFCFSTIVGWNLYARINFDYIFGKKYTHIFTALSLLFIFMGAYFSNAYAWELSDLCNQFIVIINVLALFTLSSVVARYAKNKKSSVGELLKK